MSLIKFRAHSLHYIYGYFSCQIKASPIGILFVSSLKCNKTLKWKSHWKIRVINRCVTAFRPTVQLENPIYWNMFDSESETFRLGSVPSSLHTHTVSIRIWRISHLFGDAVENFVHLHTRWVPVVSKADHKDSVLLGQNGLVDLPAIMKMW